MPELPEVETIRQGLTDTIRGKQISGFEVRLPKVFKVAGPERDQRIIGSTILSVERRGKLLLLRLSTGVTLLIHLKMTGQLIYREGAGIVLAGGHPTNDMVTAVLPRKSTHAIFRFSDGSELFFNDQRTFGYIMLVPNPDVSEVPLIKAFGPEPLGRAFTPARFGAMLKRRPHAKLKPLLLDQSFIAGLGNIYVDEALNLAKLHPLRLAGSLRPAQQRALYQAIRQVLRTSLRLGGTSDNTYVTIRGEQGDYHRIARVYHRTGLPCPSCGTLIQRMVVAGRGTHYCPVCQRTPRGTG